MKRNIYGQLEKWKASSRRKPLVLNGARQVGKTYALKAFGNSLFKNLVYVNFEKDEKLSEYFQGSLDPKQIIKFLEIHTGTQIVAGETLLVFDEVQECPRALNSLKYFCEEANEYHLAAAGSLLGVKVSQEEGFPVGKVNFLHLYPLSFFEFLTATNHEQLRVFLEEHKTLDPLPPPLHEKLILLLKYYLFIGGMPEAVAEYIKHDTFMYVRDVQMEILNAYERDFAKHAPPNEVMKITTVWNQVHSQLAKENKKFIFSAIRKSARGRDYEEAMHWLTCAGLLYKSHLVETPKFPLSGYATADAFKIFLLDVGLLGAQSGLSQRAIIEGNLLFTEFKGALTENYIAQELIASRQQKLHYWTSAGTAEVDFLLETDHEIVPLEVKSGESQKKKSLLVYGQKYSPSHLYRTTLMNLKADGNIVNYPLYLIGRLLCDKAEDDHTSS
jgi:predicted AAA+ superfamily ATPase